MEKKNTWQIIVIIILAVVAISLYTKNKKLSEDVSYWQDEYYSTDSKLRSLKDEHEQLSSEHEEFKNCVEEHVYNEDYQEMKETYVDCF